MQTYIKGVSPIRSKIQMIYLFGSRAKGTARPDSDYDLLLVVGNDFERRDKDFLYDQVMETLLNTGRLISLKLFKDREFQRLRDLNTPFLMHVLKEGISIG